MIAVVDLSLNSAQCLLHQMSDYSEDVEEEVPTNPLGVTIKAYNILSFTLKLTKQYILSIDYLLIHLDL